jgi:hypothetical protein
MMFLLIVTLSSMLLAAIMSVIAWRLAAEERRRSDARVAALSAEIHAPAAAARATSTLQRGAAPRRAEVVVAPEPPRLATVHHPRPGARWDDDLPLRASEPVRAQGDLFVTAQRPESNRRFASIAAVVAIVGAAVLGATLLRGGASTPIPAAAAAAAGDNRTAAAAEPPSLELVALGHERDGDRLIVRGVVRTAASGPSVGPLTAVVFVFNAEGGFVTSARAAVDAGALRSAGESPFVVTVPDAASVNRYRVSFRSGDRIVPHVDRREPVKRS